MPLSFPIQCALNININKANIHFFATARVHYWTRLFCNLQHHIVCYVWNILLINHTKHLTLKCNSTHFANGTAFHKNLQEWHKLSAIKSQPLSWSDCSRFCNTCFISLIVLLTITTTNYTIFLDEMLCSLVEIPMFWSMEAAHFS